MTSMVFGASGPPRLLRLGEAPQPHVTDSFGPTLRSFSLGEAELPPCSLPPSRYGRREAQRSPFVELGISSRTGLNSFQSGEPCLRVSSVPLELPDGRRSLSLWPSQAHARPWRLRDRASYVHSRLTRLHANPPPASKPCVPERAPERADLRPSVKGVGGAPPLSREPLRPAGADLRGVLRSRWSHSLHQHD